ncbi:tectonin domain-containing protein [Shumkonia mesophila]|uniref:tectonin domain-containing protein n=1 Tax=Shumkonia mesophila TaxID=2838854 RepID=UPI002934C4E7|nr:tectonin domain-containing protein [Shumkonia mesophila]
MIWPYGKHLLLLLCLVTGVSQLSGLARAQGSPAEAPQWHRLPGTAVDISINSEGQAYAVAPDGTPWRWDALEQRWRRMSGRFVRITAAEANRPWAVGADGVVFRYNGLWWENKDTDVADVAADALGNVYIAKVSGEIKKWNPLRSEWRPLEGTARRLALDRAGHPWVVTGNGRIRAFDGKTWTDLPGLALDIAANGDDTVVIADAEGELRIWNAAENRWALVPGIHKVSAVAAAPDGGPWAVVEGGVIMATTLLVVEERIKTKEGLAPQAVAPQAQAPQASAPVDSAPLAVASALQAAPATPETPTAPPAQAQPLMAPAPTARSPAAAPPAATGTKAAKPATVEPDSGLTASTDPTAITAKGPITFVNTRKTASDLAIGKDGSVFGLDAGGNVLRWSNARRRFEGFPGTLARIAVDPGGNPWGISTLGRVFRHTGELWKQIPNAIGSDIAIGGDGTVMITDATGGLYRLDAAMTRFERIPGQGLLVAVAPDGTPWTIRSDSLVQRCGGSPCRVLPQKATSIAIGPDGSVYVVSDRSRLMRLGADGETFEMVQTPGHTPLRVAVGPNGYPWLVTSAELVLASAFFERDEAQDRAVAAGTAGDTTGSGGTGAVVNLPSSTGFTFSKNMKFDSYSTGLTNFSSLIVGRNDEIYVYGEKGGQQQQLPPKVLLHFNNKTKAFEETLISFPTDVEQIGVDGNDNFWGFKSGTVYKLNSKGTLSKTYSVVSGSANSLSIGADGKVHIVVGSTLYLLKTGTNAFTKFSNDDVKKVAVGRAGDLWILDDNNIVQQYTGTKFENRPLGQSIEGSAIAAGTDGTIYITHWNGSKMQLRKWNATNKSFDTVNNEEADKVGVDSSGRPWIAYTSMNNDVKRAKD